VFSSVSIQPDKNYVRPVKVVEKPKITGPDAKAKDIIDSETLQKIK
jgi:hypothetical protein